MGAGVHAEADIDRYGTGRVADSCAAERGALQEGKGIDVAGRIPDTSRFARIVGVAGIMGRYDEYPGVRCHAVADIGECAARCDAGDVGTMAAQLVAQAAWRGGAVIFVLLPKHGRCPQRGRAFRNPVRSLPDRPISAKDLCHRAAAKRREFERLRSRR